MRKCLDEGTLQGYLDGELSPVISKEATLHLAACAACAANVREAESELAMFASAFAADASLTIPSEQLRERLETAIAGIESAKPSAQTSALRSASWNWRGWFTSLAASCALNPARAAAFASLAAVVLFGMIFAVVISQSDEIREDSMAKHEPAPNKLDGAENVHSDTIVAKSKQSVTPGQKSTAPITKRPRIRHRAAPRRPAILPGEENYLNTIASLSKVVEASGDTLLSPSLRADYERNLALVNQTIDASRRNALRHPQDRDAQKFLLAAYENKVELLSVVANQSQVAKLIP